jgi:hypothetical protein
MNELHKMNCCLFTHRGTMQQVFLVVPLLIKVAFIIKNCARKNWNSGPADQVAFCLQRADCSFRFLQGKRKKKEKDIAVWRIPFFILYIEMLLKIQII